VLRRQVLFVVAVTVVMFIAAVADTFCHDDDCELVMSHPKETRKLD
jgi:hypothetical protein